MNMFDVNVMFSGWLVGILGLLSNLIALWYGYSAYNQSLKSNKQQYMASIFNMLHSRIPICNDLRKISNGGNCSDIKDIKHLYSSIITTFQLLDDFILNSENLISLEDSRWIHRHFFIALNIDIQVMLKNIFSKSGLMCGVTSIGGGVDSNSNTYKLLEQQQTDIVDRFSKYGVDLKI